MEIESKETATGANNGTPTLALADMDEMLRNRHKRARKVGKQNNGTPYWQPVRGIIRWEKRQHYYDEQGIRRTRVLASRKRKPRGVN